MKNILCFDVESNGLYGEAFAVGAVRSRPLEHPTRGVSLRHERADVLPDRSSA